jgi:hypothetical protein
MVLSTVPSYPAVAKTTAGQNNINWHVHAQLNLLMRHAHAGTEPQT